MDHRFQMPKKSAVPLAFKAKKVNDFLALLMIVSALKAKLVIRVRLGLP